MAWWEIVIVTLLMLTPWWQIMLWAFVGVLLQEYAARRR